MLPRLATLLWLAAAQPTFEAISKQAADARAQNRIPEAITLYRKAVAQRPSWAEGWWFLGEMLYDQDRYPDARDALRRLVKLDAKSGPGFALLGLCEYETKEYRQSLADINEARRLGLGDDPQINRVVLFHAVLLLNHFELYEVAMQVLEKAVKFGAAGESLVEAAGLAGLRRPIMPEEVAAQDKDLVERAGNTVLAMAAHNTAETQQDFAGLLPRYPRTPNVHYLYGTFLLAGDPEAGLRELQKELDLNPQHAAALVQIALYYEQTGDTDKALAYARRSVAAAPQFFAAHAVLGRLLTNSGAAEKGIPELELARKQAPDSPQVRFALAAAYSIAGRKKDADAERAEFLRLKKLADETSGNHADAH